MVRVVRDRMCTTTPPERSASMTTATTLISDVPLESDRHGTLGEHSGGEYMRKRINYRAHAKYRERES